MSHHVSASAVWNADLERLHLLDQQVTNRAVLRKFKPGAGEVFVVLVMRPEDAAVWGQFKHLYGHLYTPVASSTGETVPEVHLRMKATPGFLPDDGRTSLTELSRAELQHYIEAVEQSIREEDPDSWEHCLAAMALYDRRNRH
jgi:hypothetical protein